MPINIEKLRMGCLVPQLRLPERAGWCDPLTHGKGLSPRSCNLNQSRAYRLIPLQINGVFAPEKLRRMTNCGWYRGGKSFVPILGRGYFFVITPDFRKEKLE